MIIPAGFGHALFIFAGQALPFGAASTLGFENANDLSAQECADAFSVAFVATILPNLSSAVEFSGTLVKLGPNDTGPTALSPTTFSGGAASSSETPQVAILVSKITALGGREGRGRMYLPGLDEESTAADGSITGGVVAALDSDFDAFAAALAVDGIGGVVLHSSATAPTPITSYVVNAQVATQRRRNRR